MLGAATAAALAVALLAPGPWFPLPAGLAWAVGSGLFEAGYFAALALALRAAPLGVAYTVSRGGAIALVWPLSALWLGETVSARGLGGAALVCAGLGVVGLASGARAARPGVALAGLAALCIAGYHLAYKQALLAQAGHAALFAVSLAVALPLNLGGLGVAGRVRAWRCLRARPLRLGGAGVLATGSFLLFLAALAQGGAGTVLTLRNLSVVFAQAMGVAMGERPGRLHVAGVILVAGGAVLLGWPR
jgi:drug/metabolite transporter (DMT)-like permease